MDMNEMLQQLANNPQMAAQLVQLVQAMQQNGMIPPNMGQPRSMANWNMPTNPMAAMWANNMSSMMNNMGNQNNSQPTQNQGTQSSTPQPSQTDNKVSSVRVVKTPNEIKADEILMNGDISLFLQDDLKVVYGKRWTNNGTIDNMRFVREEEEDQNAQQQLPASPAVNSINLDVEALMTQISKTVEGKLDQFVKDYSLDKRTSTKSGTNKKGADENGD